MTAAATADRAYDIDILGMHCASCVRRVEEALLAVPGVAEAAVNLVEKRARVRGGDPEAAMQAVLAQGYGAALQAPAATDSFFLRLEAMPDAEEVEQITDVLQARDRAAEVVLADGRLRVTTAEHPADVLLRLHDLGFQAELEEDLADLAVEQANEARREDPPLLAAGHRRRRGRLRPHGRRDVRLLSPPPPEPGGSGRVRPWSARHHVLPAAAAISSAPGSRPATARPTWIPWWPWAPAPPGSVRCW